MIEMVRSWWREPDHYRWITTTLAASGAQSELCRGMALLTAGLGVLPVVMVFSPAGPQSPGGRLVSVAVAAGALTLAFICLWLRGRWPRRWQSILFVSVSGIGIMAAALVQTHPASGFAAAISFAALSGYCALVHTTRYSCYLLIAAAPVVGILAIRLSAMGDPVWALSMVISIVVVTISVAMMCHTLVQLLGINVLNSDLEPLTGLLNRQAFYASVSEFIACGRGDDRYLLVAVASLDNFSLLMASNGVAATHRVRVNTAQTLRETTRRDAVIAHIGETDFLIAHIVATSDIEPLIERFRGAIATTPPNLTVSVGAVCVMLNDLVGDSSEQVLDQLVDDATLLMSAARRDGGDQSCHVVRAPRRAHDDETQ